MAPDERRQEPRHALRMSVQVETADGVVAGDTLDIGVDGIHVVTTQPIVPGTSVTVTLETAASAYIRGQVIWILETGSSGLPLYHIGIGADAMGIGESSAVGHAEKNRIVQTVLDAVRDPSAD